MGKGIFFNVSGGGHVIATYGMVGELVERGEKIIYYEAPHYKADIEALGAEFRSYGPIRPFPGPPPSHPFHHEFDLANAMVWTALEFIPQIIDRVREDKPDYIIHDSLSVWGKVIAHLLGVPAFCCFHIPAINWPVALTSPRLWLDLPDILKKCWPGIRYFFTLEKQLRETYGTPRMTPLDAFTNFEPVNICHAPREFQPRPQLLGKSFHFVGAVHTRPNSQAKLPPGLADEVIYIGFGTICDPGQQFFRDCVKALADHPMQVVMVLSYSTVPEDLGEIPPNFIVWSLRRDGLLAQLEVLSRAKVFIMNGGNGGAREAAWFSVPMLAVPPTFETDLISICIQDQGAGIHIRPADANPTSIRKAVDELLSNPNYRENSARIGNSCRKAGGGRRAAEIILDAVRGRNTRDHSYGNVVQAPIEEI